MKVHVFTYLDFVPVSRRTFARVTVARPAVTAHDAHGTVRPRHLEGAGHLQTNAKSTVRPRVHVCNTRMHQVQFLCAGDVTVPCKVAAHEKSLR